MILWNLFEIAANAFQAWLFVFFMNSKIPPKEGKAVYGWICMAAITFFFSLFIVPVFYPPEMLVWLFPFLYAVMASDEHALVCAFWTLVLATLCTNTVNLFMHACQSLESIPFEVFMVPGWPRAAYILTSNLTMFLTIYTASKIRFARTALAWPVMLALLVFVGGMMAVEELVFYLQVGLTEAADNRFFFYVYLMIHLLTLAALALFHLLAQSAEREADYRSQISMLTMTRKHQQELEQLHSELRMKLHDFRHHMQTLETLVNTSGSEEAQSYLRTYRQGAMDREVFLTGCTGVDAILTAKQLTMKTMGIRFEYTGYPLNELPVAQPDFCAMLGNVLDNAIESVGRMSSEAPSPTIKLTLSRSWDMFYVYCQNPCDPQTLKRRKGQWITSKADGELHGLGLNNVRSIAERIGGRCAFECRENTFLTKIVLPFGPDDAKSSQNAAK